MIEVGALLDELTESGVSAVTGVPCSYLSALINRVASSAAVAYLPVAHEADAIALAAGSWLAGATTCVIAQNSGLGNMVNPLTSLSHPARIPVPLVVTWRGEPGRTDEPQHQLLGAIMPDLLDLVEVTHSLLLDDPDQLGSTIRGAFKTMQETNRPHAFILRQGALADEPLDEPDPASPHRPEPVRYPGIGAVPTRIAALETLLSVVPDDAAIVSTTGKTSRELFTLADRPQHFYVVGAMGSASTVGLGVARNTTRLVVVVDGDGAALMRLGAFAAIGTHGTDRLVHVLLDNGVHDSTGGQRTLSAQVDFAAIAAACGYRAVHSCIDLISLESALRGAVAGGGPTLIHLAITPGSLAKLGRPTVGPAEVARRFRAFVTGEAR